MSGTSQKPLVNLKLFIDEQKNKVLFAEAGKDFVDILFSLLTLPMGTIVRLMKMYQKSDSIAIRCFNNIYASVVNMEVKHFRAEAYKQMLLYPRSMNQGKYQNLKLRIDDSDTNKCFVCPSFSTNPKCREHYSNVNTSKCSCGNLMSKVIQIDKEGIASDEHTLFIITDDLKVDVISGGFALNVLKDLGYAKFDNLAEKICNCNVEEVVLLLECLFTSDTPLTDTFLKKRNSYDMLSIQKTLSPALFKGGKESKPEEIIRLNAYVNRKERNILYVECGEDFVDLLFTFLAMPLQSVWETSVNRSISGCIGNLCRSCSDLSVDYRREAKCVLPYYYKCQKQLFDFVTFHKPPTYYSYISYYDVFCPVYSLSKTKGYNSLEPVISIYSKLEGGFVKRGIKFMVTDDLIIKPLDLTSTIGFLKDKQLQLDDVEVQDIIVRKEKAIKLLEASLLTSSALSTCLLPMVSTSTSVQQSLFLKKPKTETGGKQ